MASKEASPKRRRRPVQTILKEILGYAIEVRRLTGDLGQASLYVERPADWLEDGDEEALKTAIHMLFEANTYLPDTKGWSLEKRLIRAELYTLMGRCEVFEHSVRLAEEGKDIDLTFPFIGLNVAAGRYIALAG